MMVLVILYLLIPCVVAVLILIVSLRLDKAEEATQREAIQWDSEWRLLSGEATQWEATQWRLLRGCFSVGKLLSGRRLSGELLRGSYSE